MKWRTPHRIKESDQRRRVKFAWFPAELNNGYTVWLEFYGVLEEFRIRPRPTKCGTITFGDWDVVERYTTTRDW